MNEIEVLNIIESEIVWPNVLFSYILHLRKTICFAIRKIISKFAFLTFSLSRTKALNS